MDIKSYIKDKSKELNIDVIGFTDALPLVNIKDYLYNRQAENKKTEFEEDDINKRIDPILTLPSCKSIIVIGISYNVDYKGKPDYRLKGSLSKSSWGLDYHRVLKNKMELLIDEIKKIKDFEYLYFADTGPLVDRELARKAGIGYYGKNCSIINKEYGSYIFLGYILTNLDIEPNRDPSGSECGDCDLCIRACPTKALEAPFTLNPKRCISYLTQTKDSISIELREKMGIKIYGCDTCQKVCPKNKGIIYSQHQEFMPDITKGAVNLEEILQISNKDFKKKYGAMAGSWRGKNILKRNAIIALGNMKSRENLQYLIKELDNDSAQIAKYAAWAILNIFLTSSSNNR